MSLEDQTNPSGDNTQSTPDASGEGKQDTVAYDSFAKVLGEKKAERRANQELRAKIAEFEAEKRALEEAKLLEEKNFGELLAHAKEENERLRSEVSTHIKDKTDFRKLNAALGVLQDKGIQLESKYLSLLPIDEISIDEESGQIDGNSLATVIDSFQKEHPRLTLPKSRLLPNEASGDSGASKMSLETWKSLSREERKKIPVSKVSVGKR